MIQRLSLLIALSCVSGLALAQQEMEFGDLDTDGDGYISRQEAQQANTLADNFNQADTDSDNRVDISEFSAFESSHRFTPSDEEDAPEPGAAPLGED